MAHKRANQMFSPRSPDLISYTPGAIYARSSTKPKIVEDTNKRIMQIRKLKLKQSQPESLMDYSGLQVVGGSRRALPSTSTNQPITRNLLIPKRNPKASQLQLHHSSVDELLPSAHGDHRNPNGTSKGSPQNRFRIVGSTVVPTQHPTHQTYTAYNTTTESSLPELHKRGIRLHPVTAAPNLHRTIDEPSLGNASISVLPKHEPALDVDNMDREQLWKLFLEQHAHAAKEGVSLVEGKGGRGKIREDTLQDVLQCYQQKLASSVLKLVCFKSAPFKEHKKILFITFEGLLGYRAANTEVKTLQMIMQSLNQESLQLNDNQLVLASGTDKLLKSLARAYNIVVVMENSSSFSKEISHNLGLKYSEVITAIYGIERPETGGWTGGYRRVKNGEKSFSPPQVSFSNVDDNLTLYLDRATSGQLGSSASGTQIAGRSELIFLFPIQVDVDYLKFSAKSCKDKTLIRLDSESCIKHTFPWIPIDVKEQVLGITSLFVPDLRFRQERLIVNKKDPKQHLKAVHINFDQLQMVLTDLGEPQGYSLVRGYSLSLLPPIYTGLHNQLKMVVLSDLTTVTKHVLSARRPESLLAQSSSNILSKQVFLEEQVPTIQALSSQQIETQNSKFRERYYTKLDGMKLKDDAYAIGSELIRNNTQTLTKVCQQPVEHLYSDEYDAYLKDSKIADMLTAQHPLVKFLAANFDSCLLVD